MATNKVKNAKFVTKRSRWQLGNRAIVIAIVLATIVSCVGKDIGRSMSTEQSRQLPAVPIVRSDNARQDLSRTDLLPSDVENAIRQSIMKHFHEEEEVEEAIEREQDCDLRHAFVDQGILRNYNDRCLISCRGRVRCNMRRPIRVWSIY
jgi:hypothetical protein